MAEFVTLGHRGGLTVDALMGSTYQFSVTNIYRQTAILDKDNILK
jgi:hypothetical protein